MHFHSGLEYKAVVRTKRRILIPRIYVLAYELWEGSIVQVTLYEARTSGLASFLAQVQKGFRIQIPELELKPGTHLDVRSEKKELHTSRRASYLVETP